MSKGSKQRPTNHDSYSSNWDTIFGKNKPAAHTPQLQHSWKYTGTHGHNGEDWYQCRICGAEDWIARYGEESQLRPVNCTGKK